MKGAILQKGEKFYTDLLDVFNSIGNIQNEYNWLITNLENCIWVDKKEVFMNEKGFKDYVWISGEELTKIQEENYNFQWIWGVFSGFKKDVSKDEVLKNFTWENLPFANGYDGFWKNPISIQHPLADIEIVAWDSTLTLLISRDDQIVDRFMKNKSYAQSLEEYNEEIVPTCKTLSNKLTKKIDILIKIGDILAKNKRFSLAMKQYQKALDLLPPPKSFWEINTRIYVALADICFFTGKYQKGLDYLFEAQICFDVRNDPFIMLRIGQCFFELDRLDKARVYLYRAYSTAGKKVFDKEDRKYLEFLEKSLEQNKGSNCRCIRL